MVYQLNLFLVEMEGLLRGISSQRCLLHKTCCPTAQRWGIMPKRHHQPWLCLDWRSMLTLVARCFTRPLVLIRSVLGFGNIRRFLHQALNSSQAMTSGAIAGFLDVAYNFNTQKLLGDNLIGTGCCWMDLMSVQWTMFFSKWCTLLL